jgi:nitrous oxidase accessory protein
VDISQNFTHNAFVHNDIGLLFNPSVKRNNFGQNSFIDNLEQVGLTGSGTFEGNSFSVDGRGNFWSDYAGYDAAGDGLGDLPYVSKSLFENMICACSNSARPRRRSTWPLVPFPSSNPSLSSPTTPP